MTSPAKPCKTAAELQSMIASEFAGDIGPDAVVIVAVHSTWRATLPSNGARIDEALAAAVSDISRRLADRYALVAD